MSYLSKQINAVQKRLAMIGAGGIELFRVSVFENPERLFPNLGKQP